MMTLETHDAPNGGVLISISGHSNDKAPGGEKEAIQVCASASHMMMTLVAIFGGSYNGDSSGYMQVVVPGDKLAHAEFVIAGLRMLGRNYPMHIRYHIRDSRLLRTAEAQSWKASIQQFEAKNA